MKNVILTDCDGVILDWWEAFSLWMSEKGYKLINDHEKHYEIADKYCISKEKKKSLVREFNESENMGSLPPFKDAIHYIKKLHEKHGYVFHAITSMSNDTYAQELRKQNIKNLFGETAFFKFSILDTGADKDHILEAYRDSECIWVEDHVKNAELGHRMGLRSFIMDEDHNQHCSNEVIRIKSWKDLYENIVGY